MLAGLDSPRGLAHVPPVASRRLVWASLQHGNLRVVGLSRGWISREIVPTVKAEASHLSLKGGFQV